MAKEYKLSAERFQALKDELNYLKTVREREVADQIKEARSFGDLSENSEYDEAKNEQGIIEARIAEIEKILQNVKVLDSNDLSTEHISIGNKIVLKNLATKEVIELHIVGSKEVDKKNGKISDESPVGKACLGRTKGEIVEVDAPIGIIKYEVMDISK